MSEKPVRDRPRRLADWLNPTGDKKVHSLVDKVYKRWNLEDAWLRVKSNGGAGGVDGQTLMEFERVLEEQLDRLHEELKNDTYQPLPVRRQLIPKAGQPGKFRPLGIPAIYDRVCQQALLNRLEPIFEPVFDDASFGYRKGRSTKDALRKIWKELGAGAGWIVDAEGRHTTDPKQYRKGGALLPLGGSEGYKGSGLAGMVEVLCGLLTGLGFGVEPTGRHNDGCFMAVFNVAAFRPLQQFKSEVAEFARYLKQTPPSEGSAGVFYPGEVEYIRERERKVSGIEIEGATWDKLRALAGEYGLAAELDLT